MPGPLDAIGARGGWNSQGVSCLFHYFSLYHSDLPPLLADSPCETMAAFEAKIDLLSRIAPIQPSLDLV